jgi:hypothetical protein
MTPYSNNLNAGNYCRESYGILRYSQGTQGPRLVLECDWGIAMVTRALIPKYYPVRPQKYAPHVTVVRHERPRMDAWKRYEGKRVDFLYDPWVYNDETYWWLSVSCDFLKQVRIELGLKPTRFTPQDALGGFHMTVGNTKNAP